MATTINASASSGLITTADTSTILQLQTNGTAAVTIGTDQSFNFSATGQRITGDFSNATVANRVMFQSSTTNGNTLIGAIPNGTGQNARIQTFASSDPTNTATLSIESNSSISQAAITSGITGTGTYLPMTFYTGGTESLRLSATTKAVILAGGSTSANGTGITFPATQSASSDANTLDDYEEGVWTPSLGGTTTYSTQSGTYTKVGRLVFVRGILVITTIGTGSTTQISGLPFANASGSVCPISVGSFFSSATAVTSFFAAVSNGGSVINVNSLTAAGTTEGSSAIFANSTQFQFSGCYSV